MQVPDSGTWESLLSQTLDGEGPDPQLLFLCLLVAQLDREGASKTSVQFVDCRPTEPICHLLGHCQPTQTIQGKC